MGSTKFKFGQLILRKIIKIVATRCQSYFKAKMHQIRFRLELRHRPRWGSSQRSPDFLPRLRGLLLRKGEGGAGKRGTGKGDRMG